MKKIRISENELISLIEKAVNENLGTTPSLTAHGGGFSNLGMGKPTDKYKDLYEDDDIEEEMVEDQDPGTEKSSAVAIDQEKDVEDDWTGGSGRNPSMNIESIVNRLKKKLNEEKRKLTEGKCPKSGCVTKRGSKWRVISNITGKLWDAKYDTRKEAEDGLEAYHANK